MNTNAVNIFILGGKKRKKKTAPGTNTQLSLTLLFSSCCRSPLPPPLVLSEGSASHTTEKETTPDCVFFGKKKKHNNQKKNPKPTSPLKVIMHVTMSRMSNTGSSCFGFAGTSNPSSQRHEAFPVFRPLYLNVWGEDTGVRGWGGEEKQGLDSFYWTVSH